MNDTILELHDEGLTLREIAEQVEVSHETVRQVLKDTGWDYRTMIDKRNQDIIDDYQSGISVKELARIYDLSISMIYRILKKVPKRNSLKPIGCDECEINEYADGLCRNCYMRKWRRNLKE